MLEKHVYSVSARVYKTASGMSRYTGVRNVGVLSIRFTDLELEEIFYRGGVEERFTNIGYVIAQEYDELRGEKGGSFLLNGLLDRLHILSQNGGLGELKRRLVEE